MILRQEDDDPILTTREAARLLGVAVSTAQVWMEGGALPTWKTPGGHRRVRLSAVHGLLRQRKVDAESAAPTGEFLPCPAPAYPAPSDEARRLRALAASKLMESADEEVFDRLTWLASHVTDCPMALLTLLSGRRQWFKSRLGMTQRETPREVAFCSHTIMQDGAFVVEDADADPRFAANPLVTGEPHIRFYAGYPVLDANDMALGSLCVLDREPRRLRERELRALRELAAIASDEIKRRA
ncbi:GAF domain-containing protein [Massilia sp. HP4]|uniref:GAF domain-containing protein n=1 Tax=Massilia sp. HP4 TaxID=2562316 RepID=UPI0010C0312E|nr:GAF domain-containing protein [Massilia sp. HP4]